MKKKNLNVTTATPKKTVPFSLENDEITLLEFKQFYFTGEAEDCFFSRLRRADLLDKNNKPTKKAIDNRFIYFKDTEPNLTLDFHFFPNGNRLVVGEHEYLGEYLEFLETAEEFDGI